MKDFKNYLIRKGFNTTISGSDCFLVNYIDEYDNLKTVVASASELYNNRKNLNITFKDIYTSCSGANWVSRIMKQPNSVNIFKVNSYRVDINGHVGSEFVETHYGDNEFAIYLPYNYTRNVIDFDYPAYIISQRFKRVIVCHPKYISESIINSQKYFNREENEYENSTKISLGHEYYAKFRIFDDRSNRPKKHWGTFEHPSRELKMLIRLLLRDGFLNAEAIRGWNSKAYSLRDLIPDNDERYYFEESQNVLGLEVIDDQLRRFTKYSNDLWVEIPASYGGIELIKTKNRFIYKDPLDGLRELVADIVIKMNAPDKGIYFIGINEEYGYVFQTIKYSVLDVITRQVPEYEIEAILIPNEESAEEAE